MSTRTRFAPSPTGKLHLGGLRTALYAYAYAKRQNGTFILRIEDTDQNRYTEGAVENLIDTLNNMGIEYQEGPKIGGKNAPYFQSERLDIYKQYVDELLEKGIAYYCFCSKERLDNLRDTQRANKQMPKYDRHCLSLSKEEIQQKLANGESHVIRLKMPENKTHVFYDVIRGKVEINSEQIDDQVLIKSDGYPTYHLAAVIDDHLMEISHVIRGEEWLSSTPKHIFLHESLGWKPPKWVHLPLILSTEKGKLSKRHGDYSVGAFLKKGYLKEAILNFIALLGWHPQDDKEIFEISKLYKEFSFKKVSKSGAVFDVDKLNWMNGLYIREAKLNKIIELAKPYFTEAEIDISDDQKFRKVIEVVRDRITVLSELIDESITFYNPLQFTDEQKEILSTDDSKKLFNHFIQEFTKLEDFTADNVNKLVQDGYKLLGIKGKDFYHAFRLAIFGNGSGADLIKIIDILGKDLTIQRLKNLV